MEKLKDQTRSSIKQAGVTVPNIFSKDNTLIPEVKPEHHVRARQKLKIPTKIFPEVSHQSQKPFRRTYTKHKHKLPRQSARN